MGRIIETPMMSIQLPWKHRARLIRVATNRDYGLDVLFQKIVHVLGVMRGDVDADLFHHLNAQRMHKTRRLGAGAVHFKQISGNRTQDAFSEMAAARIAGAKNKDR